MNRTRGPWPDRLLTMVTGWTVSLGMIGVLLAPGTMPARAAGTAPAP